MGENFRMGSFFKFGQGVPDVFEFLVLQKTGFQ